MNNDLSQHLELEDYDGDERRQWPRYRPSRMIPVLFRNARLPGIGAGHIVDVSMGGVRIHAPPTVTTPLRWGEPLAIMLSYSEGTREAQVEGMELSAVVVEVRSTAEQYIVRARFVEQLVADWYELLQNLVKTAA